MTFYESHNNKNKKKIKRGKRVRSATVTWLFLAAASAVLFITFWCFPISPAKARIALFAVLALLLGITGYFSLKKTRNRKRTGVSVLNSLLALSLLMVALILPQTGNDIRKIIKDLPDVEESRIAVYALTTDYKADHIEVFRNSGYITAFTDLQDYKNLQFITQKAVDQENQAFAIEEIQKKLDVEKLWLNETDNLWDAVQALYDGNGQALIMNQAYADTVEEEFPGFLTDTFIVDIFTRQQAAEYTKPIDITKDPFTVFIAGSDSRDAELALRTRTDVDIIMAVNPKTKQILICSLPRDAYIPNPAMSDSYDKLTHMGIYTISNSVKSLTQYLGFDVDRYLLVNFATYKTIVNALGGVDIENPYAFSIGQTDFPAGQIHLNGDNALSYVRARYSLPNGDFGRNEHQIIVLRAMIKKILSPDIINNFAELLDALNGMFLTNISKNSIWAFMSMQVNDMASWDIIQYHITGTVGGAECASMPGRNLSVVFPNENQVKFVKEEVEKILRGEKITQQEMPQ